jgi:hypothetical protein
MRKKKSKEVYVEGAPPQKSGLMGMLPFGKKNNAQQYPMQPQQTGHV